MSFENLSSDYRITFHQWYQQPQQQHQEATISNLIIYLKSINITFISLYSSQSHSNQKLQQQQGQEGLQQYVTILLLHLSQSIHIRLSSTFDCFELLDSLIIRYGKCFLILLHQLNPSQATDDVGWITNLLETYASLFDVYNHHANPDHQIFTKLLIQACTITYHYHPLGSLSDSQTQKWCFRLISLFHCQDILPSHWTRTDLLDQDYSIIGAAAGLFKSLNHPQLLRSHLQNDLKCKL